MGFEDIEKILAGLVRVGIVTDINASNRQARVKFQGENMTSGWLYVLQHHAAGLYIKPTGEHTHTITGGETASTEPDHNHTTGSYVTYWMPKVNDTVLVIYLPVFNADGFVVGGIG